jgi:bifunctional DNA-binding transcriptional regulator/antitoxin component of YhaV-PrlF toxin-antitoxin module
MDFDYKKYSLENLENWMHDALSCSEATPQEIYDVIKDVVSENYYIYKTHTARCGELLALLNGNGKGHLSCDKDDPSEECKGAWNDFWEEHYYPEEYKEPKVEDIMPPWGHSDMEALRYTEEELNAMCEKAASDQEKEKCREYNLREAEYYDKRAKIDLTYDEMIAAGYTMTDDGFWIPPQEEKPKKTWTLPIDENGVISFPEDLLKQSGLKEGDPIVWILKSDGSFELRKETPETQQDLINSGYSLIEDGYWTETTQNNI